MEKNKTRKYFKYAIGEILLVIIGILIALQINNWNENRKNKAIWHNFTTSLIKDLKQDITTLSYVNKYIKNDDVLLEKITERLSSQTATIDTLKKIARFELELGIKTYRPPNNKTFLAMQANGTIEFFDEETYSLLLHLQSNQGITETIVNTNNLNYFSQFSNFASKYSINNFNISKGPLLEQAWQNINSDDLFRTVEGVLASKKLMNAYNGKSYNDLLNLTEKVLDKLIKIQESITPYIFNC